MSPSVIVIGGGVAGLSAAHELIERGFTVDVFEARPDFGGKARSQPVPDSGRGGRRDLPGEHGFRFYPRFYRHVIDTMERIPLPAGGVVADRLRGTTESAIAMIDEATWFRFHRRKVTRPFDVLETVELFFQELDFDAADVALFAAKLLQFFTSCDARRLGAYDDISWWQFLEGDMYSAKFQRQLRAVPRTMVAMDPQIGSARTIGAISMQLILDFASAGVSNDRTLGGPTSQAWFEPWLAYLRARGVRLHARQPISSFVLDGAYIRGVVLPDGSLATADHFVLATPVEVAARLISPQMAAADPQLERVRTARLDTLLSWMIGIQYFLYEDVPLVRGHTFYPDAPWGLTTISQAQFWRPSFGLFRRAYGDGSVGGVISVDVSEWNTPGDFVKKPARMCTPREIAHEVWEQLKAALNTGVPGEEVLRDELLHSWHLDDDLDYSRGVPPTNHNRLLVHPPGAWRTRPEAETRIPNLVLASDYVRTHTDLASMEGANEAARRAVNAILARTGSGARPAGVWPLAEPDGFEPWKRLDDRLYHGGRRHLFELLGIRRAAQAADIVRRFTEFTGIDRIDDLLDSVRASELIRALLAKLGIA
ncbi:MAG: FAD-dependent oxidoreductase [Deltaproteobacteria bacterium]|nr:FAD-dependent oxidoreductase [Deltaproteobacteria bacterium]